MSIKEYERSRRLEEYEKDREERGYFNIEDFRRFFSKIVKDINTCSHEWRTNCAKEIHYGLERYLFNEKFYNHLFDFNLKVEKIGQSNVCFKLNYKEFYHSKFLELEFFERLSTPSEVRRLLFNTFQNAMIVKTIRDNGKQVNETKEPHICQGHKKDTFKCTSKASIFENNKWFCKRHAPSKIKEREEKSWDNYIKKINNSKEN